MLGKVYQSELEHLTDRWDRWNMKHNSMKKRAEKTRERTAKATKCVLERKFKRKTSKSLQKFTVTKIKARREKNANKKFKRKEKIHQKICNHRAGTAWNPRRRKSFQKQKAEKIETITQGNVQMKDLNQHAWETREPPAGNASEYSDCIFKIREKSAHQRKEKKWDFEAGIFVFNQKAVEEHCRDSWKLKYQPNILYQTKVSF